MNIWVVFPDRVAKLGDYNELVLASNQPK